MRQFHIGNVIKSPEGSLWIVTECDERIVQAISFDSENCSAVQRLEDHTHTQTCHDCMEEIEYEEENDSFYENPDCPKCKGKLQYEVPVKGWKHSKVLAPTVKDFILKGVRKAWGF